MKDNLRHFWFFSPALLHDFIKLNVYFRNYINIFLSIIDYI